MQSTLILLQKGITKPNSRVAFEYRQDGGGKVSREGTMHTKVKVQKETVHIQCSMQLREKKKHHTFKQFV